MGSATTITPATPTPELHQDDISNLPPAIEDQMRSAKIVQGSPSGSSVASVDANSPDTIAINNPARFNQPGAANQTLAHEATHLIENNLPPTMQSQIPQDDPNHPYYIGDIDQLRAQGHTITSIPREKAATIVQKYVANPNGPDAAKLKPWVDDLENVPQSTILPTKPSAGPDQIEVGARPPKGAEVGVELHAEDIANHPNHSKKKGAK